MTTGQRAIDQLIEDVTVDCNIDDEERSEELQAPRPAP